MKKLFLILFAAIWVVACNKDDDSPAEPEIPSEEKLVAKVEGLPYPSEISMEYNQDKTVRSLNLNNDLILDFSYENNQVARVESIVISYTFTHNADGILTSFTTEGVATMVNYDPATRTYDYIEPVYEDEISIEMTVDGDVKEITSFNPMSQETEIAALQFENSKKGPMANSRSISLYYAISSNAPFLLITHPALTKKPVKALAVDTDTDIYIVFENEYDSQDFIETQRYTFQDSEKVTTYNYFALEN